MSTMFCFLLFYALPSFVKAGSFSCVRAGTEACAYTASSKCGSFTINSASDVDAWLTADEGRPCTVIGGSLTIQKGILASDLTRMSPLVAVCGAVSMQQLAVGTLEGLNNFTYIGGSFAFSQNAKPWSSGDLTDISALSKMTYVGGAISMQQNYYLTESSIAAAFSNLKVAGVVNIEFYDNSPTTPGATATATGSANACTGSAPSTTTGTSMSTPLTEMTSSTEMPSQNSFSCAKAEPTSCAYTASSNCSAFTISNASDVDAWLTADDGQPCTVIGGSLTIQKGILASDLARMSPLVAVCGAVTIQQLAVGTLEGLDNLSYIGGSFFFAQNARPWSSGDLKDISALSKMMYVGGAINVVQNYYLTESSIAAAFSNLKVAGAVNIEFYDNPPTAGGATATKTGSVNECMASIVSPESTETVEGTILLTVENVTESSTEEFRTGIANGIAVVAQVASDQVTVTISTNTRRLRSTGGRRIATSLRIDYRIQMASYASPSVIVSNLNAATPSSLTASITKALFDVGITQTVSVVSITASIFSASTTLQADVSSLSIRASESLLTACIVFMMSLRASC